MAYKFQLGSAILSGSTEFEEAVTVASLDANNGGISNAGAIAGATSIDGSGDLTMGSITMTGVVSGSGFFDMVKDKLRVDGVVVSTTAAELNLLDGVTATTTELNYVDVSSVGTVEASKAVVVDGDKDASGFRNLSASAEVAAFSLDLEGGANIAGDIDSAGDLTAASITMTGVVSGSGFFDMVKDKLRVDGVVVSTTAAELNYLDGADSSINSLTLPDNTTISAFGKTLVDDADASAARATLGVEIGSDVQAHGDVLDDFNTLGAASADGEFIVATGAGAFAYESGATARTSLGLGTSDDVQFAAISGSSIQLAAMGSAVSNLAGAGLTVTAGALTVDGASVTKLGDSDASLAVGVNVYDAAAPSNNNVYTLPSGSSLSVGDVIRVKAGALQTNAVSASIRVQGTDKIEGVETELNLESNGAAVTIIYVDSDGKFVVF